MLTIPLEKVCYLIIKAREFDAKMDPEVPEPGDNPTDDEKAEAITALARERALKLSPDIVGYLLRHVSRDMRTLAMLVVALDQYTLEQKRPVTLPLLRELLSAPQV